MQRFRLIAVAILISCLTAAAAPAQIRSREQVERYIIESEHQWAESVVTSDASGPFPWTDT